MKLLLLTIAILIPVLQITSSVEHENWPWLEKCHQITPWSDQTYTESQLWTYLQLMRSHKEHTLGLQLEELCHIIDLCTSRNYKFCSLKTSSKTKPLRLPPTNKPTENSMFKLFWNYVKETIFKYRTIVFNLVTVIVGVTIIGCQLPCVFLKLFRKCGSKLKTKTESCISQL